MVGLGQEPKSRTELPVDVAVLEVATGGAAAAVVAAAALEGLPAKPAAARAEAI